jgi:hypothetical protein
MEYIIAKVIEFYVSDSLSKQSRDIARKKCGNLIEFRSPKTDQANSNSAQCRQCMVYIARFAANSASNRTGDTRRAIQEKRWAIRMRSFCNLGRIIRCVSTHLGLRRTRRQLSVDRGCSASRLVLSQMARHCFPHRPRHLNWPECSSITPPHSGHRQFAMEDCTYSFD